VDARRAAELFDRIVDFPESKNSRRALRTYSSGMVMRLAFSVGIHPTPTSHPHRRVLAVGDA